ncbi:MAG: hypothetical protein ACOZE5_08995 [Verrucomicrobiota bacterium]
MDLRFTDTNSANDTKGRALGLEGNDFIYVVAGFVLGLALFLGLAFVLKVWLPFAAAVGLGVLLAPTAWMLLFRHNKPEGYAEDWFDQRATGGGWTACGGDQLRPQEESHA